ncbi:MAG: DUF2782 domain-containing protein [Mariprofundaceae bacterium]|nr:DUF2782 domain-containing protein [Mariprofundaceae bacterium]
MSKLPVHVATIRLPLLSLLLLGLFVSVLFVLSAQAEDTNPALPPPTKVQDSPAAQETIEPSAGLSAGDLHEGLPTSDDQSNVEIFSSTRKDGTKIEEYSHRGHVYMVKVTPPGGLPPYYLYDQNGDGKFPRHLPGGMKGISPPEWVIQRF